MSLRALLFVGFIVFLLGISGCEHAAEESGTKPDNPNELTMTGVGVEAAAPVASPVEMPSTAQEREQAQTEAKARGEEPPLSCSAGCSSYRISGSCCNIFGCNCDGPCWNAGCKTTCQEGKYPGYTLSCPGKDGYYNCCRTGTKCKAKSSCDAKKGECCCTGEGREIVSISSIEYKLDNSKQAPDTVSQQVHYKYKGENSGPSPLPVGTVKSTVTSSQTTEWSFESATEISASATFEAGIPFFEKGKVTVGVKETLKYGEKHTKAVATSLEIQLGGDMIPKFSNQEYLFRASMYQYNIPFSAVAVVINDCGEQSKETITGSTKLSGVASFTEGEFTKIIGPAVPVECKKPFDIPIDEQRNGDFCSSGPQCKDNALCVRYGQTTGTCCAADNLQPCCAIAAANKKCVEEGYDPDRQLCPAKNGNFAPCCNSTDSLTQRYGNPPSR